MATRSVGFRLGAEGKADVVSAFREVATAGKAAANDVAEANEQAGARAAQATEAFTERQMAAFKRQATAAKLAAAGADVRGQFDAALADRGNGSSFATVNLDRSTGAARASAAAFAAELDRQEQEARQAAEAAALLAREEDQLAQRTRALLAAINPAYAAQQRFDAEMGDARDLISRGAISLDDYCAKLRIERGLLDQSAGAHGRAAGAAGSNRAALAGLSFQAQDAFTQISMGTNALSVLAVQGGQAAGQMMHMEGAAGSFARFIIGPYGLAITGGLLLLGALIDKGDLFGNSLDKQVDKLREHANAAEQDRRANEAWGRTVDGMIERTRTLTDELNRQIQTQDQLDRRKGQDAKRYAEGLMNGSRGDKWGQGGLTQTLRELTAERAELRRLSASSGSDETGGAAYAAARAERRVAELEQRARTLRTSIGNAQRDVRTAEIPILDRDSQGRIDPKAGSRREIETEQGRLRAAYAAGTISRTAYGAAMDAQNRKLEALNKTTDKHAQSLGRQAAAMEVNADGAIRLADAYLTGGDAALRAEVARKGATDATRRGIDIEAQTRRQLAIMVGDQVVAGAKNVAQLREEADARTEVLNRVANGTLPIEGMNRALADEAALRPLLKLRTVAQGEALAALNRVIDAYRKGLEDAHAAEDKMGLAAKLAQSREAVEELRAGVRDLAHGPLDQVLNAANRAANREANTDRLPVGSPERVEFVRTRVDEARAGWEAQRDRALSERLADQRDQLALTQRELELVGASAEVRERELGQLRLRQELSRRYGADLGAQGQQIIDNAAAQDKLNAKLRLAAAASDEMRQAGERFLDDLLNPDGSGIKNLLHDIEQEFVRLALLNPLKNLLFGQRNTTIGDIIGAFGGGGVGGKTGVGSVGKGVGTILMPGKNATGTERWSGGMTWVGENGPELVGLPEGARVMSAASSRSYASNDNAMPAVHIDASIHAPGADPAALARLEANQREMQKNLPGLVRAALGDIRARSHGRG